jgi:hypothetical protein
MLSKASHWKRTTALRKTVMYSLAFADGRTGYVVVPQELVEHGDENVPSIARGGQHRGEVPGGDIIKRKAGSVARAQLRNQASDRGVEGAEVLPRLPF